MKIDQAEEIRRANNLTVEQFSLKLRYSARAYAQALRRRKLSRWMGKEIAQRFHIKDGN